MEEPKNIENLSERYKRNIYKIPERYFDDLSARILKKCFVKQSFYPSFFNTLYFKTALAVTCVLILIFIGKNTGIMVDEKETMNYVHQLDGLKPEDFISSYQFSESDVIELYTMSISENDNFFSILNTQDII